MTERTGARPDSRRPDVKVDNPAPKELVLVCRPWDPFSSALETAAAIR